MRTFVAAVFAVTVFAGCASAPQVSSAVMNDLAPTGKLRVGTNFGNVLLTGKDAATGEPRGIVVDLAGELGRRLGVPVAFVGYPSAGALSASAKSGAWDIAFLGAEPQRADEIDFTAAYLEIEATYLVPPGSPIESMSDVDRPGVRVAVPAKSAYDLYLTRTLKNAQLVRGERPDGAYAMFVKDRLEALAGLKARLVEDHAKLPGSRLLEGSFTSVQQAIGTHKDRAAGAQYLRGFVEEAKAKGLVAKVIEANGVKGVSVAPPSR